MKSRFGSVAVIMLILALGALAAVVSGIDGSWTAGIPRPSGHVIDATFNFQVQGSKLTGTVQSLGMEASINDGKVKDDEISFTIDGTNGLFSGKLVGDEIKMKVRYERGEGGGRTMSFVAKRGN